MNELTYQFCLAGGVSLLCLATPTLSQAQITSDGTLSTEVTTSDNRNFTITSGSRAEGNLFHSFREFSVPNGGTAIFNNALDVQNIISRVTGGSISNIDGLIQANSSANLFLINPNGIIFGPDAQLDIGGSFLASTANHLNFGDGTFFSATEPQAQPLLTISVPSGLQFGATAGRIINQSVAENSRGFPVGLQLQPGKTLALVGGGVFLKGGRLFAPGGKIELGSVAGSGLVSLTPSVTGWMLGYEGVQSFQDIQLSQLALINTGGRSFGSIQLRGKQITITDNSVVGGLNLGANPGGTLAIKASESIEVSRNSDLSTGTLSTGAAGDITIETRRLIVRDRSFIDALSDGDGRGGNITVDASEFVELIGNGLLTQLSTQSFAGGNAGDVKVKTGRLILRDGGQISSSTTGAGNGGSVIVDASQVVEVSGQGKAFEGEVRGSGLLTQTEEPSATGNGGLLKINTKRLVVQGGARISAAAVEGSKGQAGSLDINASESVKVSGIGSTLLAKSESPNPAGNLTISTDKLTVRDGAELSVSSTGVGAAGNLAVSAGSIELDNRSSILATTAAGNQGNITLRSKDLVLLRRGSKIATDATSTATGGNITIDTNVLVALEDSDITANAQEAFGGRVIIDAQAIFRTQDSDITATSELGPEFSGTVELNSPDIDPSQGVISLPAELVDVSGLIAQGCPAGGGTVGQGQSEFIITGRGGLPPSPSETLRSDAVRVGTPTVPAANQSVSAIAPQPPYPTTMPLVEAQGWVTNTKGEVILTATAPTLTPHSPWLTPVACLAPKNS